MDLTQLSTLGAVAISPAQPAGADVRDQAEFDLLQNEIAKLSSFAGSGGVDWNQVVTQAAALTGGKGKDIMVACYLAGGLLQVHGLDGLATGLQVLDDMVQSYWDTMYPPVARLRARRNALQWLIERVVAHAAEHDWSSLPPQQDSLVKALRDRLAAIDAFMAEKDADAPSLRPIINQVGNLLVKESAPPPPIAPAATAPVDSAPAALSPTPAAVVSAPSSAVPALVPPPMAALAAGPVDSSEAAEAVSSEALQRLADIAQWLGEGELNQPTAFRLNRVAAWTAIEQLPPANGGKTNLPGPVPQVQDALKAMQNRQADEDLVRFAEAQLAIFPFWLDLNAIAAEALLRLGPAYERARREVLGASAWLVARHPDIAQLSFSSGMPFANAQTRDWLASLGKGAGDQADAPRVDPAQAVSSKARALAAEGDLGAAAQLLQQAIQQSGVPAHCFRLRVQLCTLLFAERPGANLLPFARLLLEEVDRYHLTQWDPPLAAAGLEAAWRILAGDDALKPESDALLVRLASIDAEAAVRLVT